MEEVKGWEDMPGYKQPCMYCEKFISSDSYTCPYCGRRNPLVLRCPKCSSTIEKSWKSCSCCGLRLETICPTCGKLTFFGDYCDHCDSSLTILCPNPRCRAEQYPIGDKCIKCGKKLKK